MKPWVWWLLLGLPAGLALGVGLAILAAPDPAYRLAKWTSLGRFRAADETIRRVATSADLDPLLLKAMAWQASAFDAKKSSADGRRGLLQLTAAQGRDWAAAEQIETFMPTDLLDAETNLRVGCWLLQRALADGHPFDVPERYALVAFQAGPAQAKAWTPATHLAADLLNNATPATRAYVEAVTKRWSFYRTHGE